MEIELRSRGSARTAVLIGHLLVGVAALVFAVVLIVAGRSPNAELEGAFLGLGLALALVAAVFAGTAVRALQRTQDGRGGALSLVLSIVELVVGAATSAGLVVAVQGYGVFEPWRSPLLVPSVLLVALGLAGLGLGMLDHRP